MRYINPFTGFLLWFLMDMSWAFQWDIKIPIVLGTLGIATMIFSTNLTYQEDRRDHITSTMWLISNYFWMISDTNDSKIYKVIMIISFVTTSIFIALNKWKIKRG